MKYLVVPVVDTHPFVAMGRVVETLDEVHTTQKSFLPNHRVRVYVLHEDGEIHETHPNFKKR